MQKNTKAIVGIIGILLLILIPIFVLSYTLNNPNTANNYIRECENPSESTVGKTIYRSNASGDKVHGNFGCEQSRPWDCQEGYVKYSSIGLYKTEHLYIKIRYSKNTTSSVPIFIYIDDEIAPRANFTPQNQGDWNHFVETEKIDLGPIKAGIHSLKFSTSGQNHGVADLDKFSLR